jgi:hypothetical protein
LLPPTIAAACKAGTHPPPKMASSGERGIWGKTGREKPRGNLGAH